MKNREVISGITQLISGIAWALGNRKIPASQSAGLNRTCECDREKNAKNVGGLQAIERPTTVTWVKRSGIPQIPRNKSLASGLFPFVRKPCHYDREYDSPVMKLTRRRVSVRW